MLGNKWVNGTVLHYYFFDQQTDGTTITKRDGSTEWRTWTTTNQEKDVVRRAFAHWKQLGIGLDFREVTSRDEAEIRIGFMRDDGAWSYIGRDVLGFGRDDRTMNFGWDLTSSSREFDTALHEIGHTLGFPHEHQNPNAGIVWNEEAVYAALAAAPNFWSRETTFHNIIRKIPPNEVRGSQWDANSVMHYPFGPNLISAPAQFRNGIQPAGGLSALDQSYTKTFYPGLAEADYTNLAPMQTVPLRLTPGGQRNFRINPSATRNYTLQTLGVSDTVLVLFEEVNGELRYSTGDDDSGQDRNARIRAKLFAGRKYVARVRLYYQDRAGETSISLS
jgi:hypothetical protein